MNTSDAPLLSQWQFLHDDVVPRLADLTARGEVSTLWAAGDVADAVAVAVGMACAGRRAELGQPLRGFATADSGEPGAPHFSLAQLRGLPDKVRRSAFCRADRGWVPRPRIAEQIVLGRPEAAVDMVVIRGRGTRPGSAAPWSSYLRPGGHLLVLGGDPGDLTRDGDLEPVDGSCLLRRRRGGPPVRGDGALAAAGHQRTLAKKLLEEDLVARHINLARSLARRFAGHAEQVDDLRQVAFVGLLLAARRYDPDQNASFSTYATATILGELKRHFRDKSWMMRVPRQVQETYLAIKTAREDLYQELACSPTIEQIAGRLRISEERVLEAMEAGDNFLPQSLDTGPDDDSPGRDVPVTEHAYDVLLDRTLLMRALPRLSDRERLVLKRVYLDGWTQRRVADEIGVSQMQVSRLLHASGHKIRTWTGV